MTWGATATHYFQYFKKLSKRKFSWLSPQRHSYTTLVITHMDILDLSFDAEYDAKALPNPPNLQTSFFGFCFFFWMEGVLIVANELTIRRRIPGCQMGNLGQCPPYQVKSPSSQLVNWWQKSGQKLCQWDQIRMFAHCGLVRNC